MRNEQINLESMNFLGVVDEMRKNINNRSVKSLVKQRDGFRTGSLMWNLFNSMKALKLEEKKPSYNERILAIKAEDYPYNKIEYTPYSKSLSYLLETNSGEYTRSVVEFNPLYLQIIACAIIKCNDQYMFLKRNSGISEDRLNKDVPGFVGGHVKSSDGSIVTGLFREINEELRKIDMNDIEYKPVGYIFDKSENVSKEHICCLYIVEVKNRTMVSSSSSETVIWLHEDEIRNRVKEGCGLDNWGLIAFKNLLN